MDRRQFSFAALAAAGLTLGGRTLGRAVAAAAPAVRTRWSVIESEGYDALCFWAPLAGEAASARQYAEDVAAFAPRLDERLRQTIRAVYQQIASQGNVLTHSACRFFSAGPHQSIDALLHSARNIDSVLKPAHLADPGWEGEALWERYRQFMPIAITYLEGLKAAGFPEFRRRLYEQRHARRVAEIGRLVTPYDVAAEVSLLTGRSFQPDVEIALTCFSYPRGMRMIGQKFVTWAGYGDDIILNMSAHELMHPPLDLAGPAMQAALAVLRNEPFWTDIVTRRDPSLGDLGDLPNYVEECLVQALDQIAADRRGTERSARAFFSRSAGSDVLAACFYGLLRADNYQRTGGRFEQWVARSAAAGRFAAEPLLAAGTAVLGASPRDVWQPYQPSTS